MKEEKKTPEIKPSDRPARVLIIGNIPSQNVLDKSRRYVPLCAYLEEKINARVKFVFAPDYDSIVQGMKNKEYDLVMPGTMGYVHGHPAGYNAILAPVSKEPFYRGTIIARADAGIDNLNDLKGKSICFVDRGSSSGFIYPTIALLDAGLTPGKDFSFDFVKGHDNVVLNVFLGQFDAGACFEGAHQEVFKEEPEKNGQLKVVAYTDKIYNAPLAARDDLPPALTASITEVFLSLNKTSRGQTVLKSLGEELTGYIEIDDSCYDGFRKSLQFEFETGKD